MLLDPLELMKPVINFGPYLEGLMALLGTVIAYALIALFSIILIQWGITFLLVHVLGRAQAESNKVIRAEVKATGEAVKPWGGIIGTAARFFIGKGK